VIGAGTAVRFSSRSFFLLSGCIVSEYLLISVLFDARHLERRLRWLSGIGYVGPLAFGIATAALLLFWGDLVPAAPAPVPREDPPILHRRWPLWVAHLALFAGFLELTRRLVAFRPSLPGAQAGWFVLWLAVGAASLATLLLTAVPFGPALALARRARPTLLLSVLVGSLAWFAGRWAERLWTSLGSLTLRAVAALLRLHSDEVISAPDRLEVGLRSFQIRVAPVCSGYEGIGLTLVLGAAYLIAVRKSLRFPLAFLLLPLGVLAAWSANVFRIFALIFVGSRWSARLAYGGFHSKAGWILFCCVALGIAALARRRPFAIEKPGEAADRTWNPSAAYLIPFVAMGATALAVGLVSPGFEALYPLRVLAGLLGLWVFWRSHPSLRLSPSFIAVLVGVGVFGVWVALQGPGEAERGRELQLGIASLGPGRVPWIAVRVLGSVIVAPVAEELAFRGFLLRRLTSAEFTEVPFDLFDLKAFVLSSVAFGALHQSFWAGTLAGMAYAFAQQRRGRISDAIIAHALTNALLTAGVLLGGRWELWA
jgi:exosortase E/protease (VPEID-CTERM system)